MSLQDPSSEVLSAVDAAMEWFEKAKIAGIKVVREDDPRSPNGRNKVVVKELTARPMWARFYEIETNRPMFVDRDGARKYDISEIGFERRNGYAWLGYWPEELFKTYPGWRNNAVEKSR
jgi:PelA/Pel-15E family pectate lyase